MAKHKETWYQRVWRPATAIVYLAVVLFDFIAAPIYVEAMNYKKGINYEAFREIAKFEDALVQSELVKKLNVGDRRWEPLTLAGGGLFHIAFGSILTGAAITRGLQKRDQEKYGPVVEDEYYDEEEPRIRTSPSRRNRGEEPLP